MEIKNTCYSKRKLGIYETYIRKNIGTTFMVLKKE